MSRHHPYVFTLGLLIRSTCVHRTLTVSISDLVMCRKQPGISIGRVCDKCDGKCPVCDSYVRPTTLVRICDECSFGNYQNKCVVCGGEGISDAFYCFECTRLEKDRDGCPKIINLGSSRTDVCAAQPTASKPIFSFSPFPLSFFPPS
jgi:PHD finger-like domain-containing protein 5A